MSEPPVDIRVISLSGSDRRKGMQEQLDRQPLPWQFFDAYTGLTEDIYYSDDLARRRYGRPLARAELGCFASHRALWHVASRLDPGRMMLILEDDLLVDPVFFSRLGGPLQLRRLTIT